MFQVLANLKMAHKGFEYCYVGFKCYLQVCNSNTVQLTVSRSVRYLLYDQLVIYRFFSQFGICNWLWIVDFGEFIFQNNKITFSWVFRNWITLPLQFCGSFHDCISFKIIRSFKILKWCCFPPDKTRYYNNVYLHSGINFTVATLLH